MWVAITTGGLALATAVMAYFTYRVVRTSRDAVGEAYRARVDASAPSLLIVEVSIDEGVHTPSQSAAGDYGHVDSGTPWDLEQFGNVQLSVVIDIDVVNDGAHGGQFQVGETSSLDARFMEILESGSTGNERRKQSWGWPIYAHERMRLRIHWAKTANEWAALRNGSRARGTDDLFVRITLNDNYLIVRDTGEVIITLNAIVEDPNDGGYLIASFKGVDNHVGTSRPPLWYNPVKREYSHAWWAEPTSTNWVGSLFFRRSPRAGTVRYRS
jgi:hypothetical protein